jgi:oligopeptide transport system ATP-binding protein
VARYADRVVVMYGGRVVETAAARALYAQPQHPYTRGLLASVPRLDGPAGERLVPIDGSPPDLAALPAGCAFAPRCKLAIDACRSTRPRLRAASAAAPQHLHACLLDLAGDPGAARAGARSTQGALP